MAVCPYHQKRLNIEQTQITVFGCSFSVVVGTCSDCNRKYINKALIKASGALSVDGVRYEFLEELGKEYPLDSIVGEERPKENTEQRALIVKAETNRNRVQAEQERAEKTKKRGEEFLELKEKLQKTRRLFLDRPL